MAPVTDSSVAAATVTAPVTSARRGVPVTVAGHATATVTAPSAMTVAVS
jgi:hypothetical protein